MEQSSYQELTLSSLMRTADQSRIQLYSEEISRTFLVLGLSRDITSDDLFTIDENIRDVKLYEFPSIEK